MNDEKNASRNRTASFFSSFITHHPSFPLTTTKARNCLLSKACRLVLLSLLWQVHSRLCAKITS